MAGKHTGRASEDSANFASHDWNPRLDKAFAEGFNGTGSNPHPSASLANAAFAAGRASSTAYETDGDKGLLPGVNLLNTELASSANWALSALVGSTPPIINANNLSFPASQPDGSIQIADGTLDGTGTIGHVYTLTLGGFTEDAAGAVTAQFRTSGGAASSVVQLVTGTTTYSGITLTAAATLLRISDATGATTIGSVVNGPITLTRTA